MTACVMTLTLLLAALSSFDQGRVPVVWDLHRPAVMLDRRFARELVPVAQCESRWDWRRVGLAGELGAVQVHPVHAQDMAAHGLDFGSEPDRLLWAEWLWRRSGQSWRDWSCAQ